MVRTNLSLFDNLNQLNHYAVGFDRVFDRLNDYASHQSTSNTFPPYNIRKDGDFNFEIEMALAGFGKKDIEVEVADGVLTIRSVKENEDSDDVIHRGISYRKFIRKFTMMIPTKIMKNTTLDNTKIIMLNLLETLVYQFYLEIK